MRCLNNEEASFTWLVILNALWVSKRLFAGQLAISPECARCGAFEESIEHAFFYCLLVQPLCKLLEGFMVCIWGGKFFVLEPSSVYSNVVLKLNRQEHYVFLYLLGIMHVVSWTTRQKELRDGESFSSRTLVSFYKHQIKVKIRSGRIILSSLEFAKKWVTVARLCRMVGASLTFSLDIIGT